MRDLSYWVIAAGVSIIAGVFFYRSAVKVEEKFIMCRQFWNHLICFFIGVFGILYYFIFIRLPQIKNGTPLSLSDVILFLLLLVSSIGNMPYLVDYITKETSEIIKKAVGK